jgi:hypothetical protein
VRRRQVERGGGEQKTVKDEKEKKMSNKADIKEDRVAGGCDADVGGDVHVRVATDTVEKTLNVM